MDAEVNAPQEATDAGSSRLLRDPARLAALERYAVLDTPAEPHFDDIARMAAQICRAPVALISLVAEDRQFFKARVGVGHTQTPLDESFCAAALSQTELLVIPDLSADRRTRFNPLVLGRPRYGFYAGAPLRTPDGHVIGTLCVIDRQPRPEGLAEVEASALRTLARQVMVLIESRRALAERDGMLASQRRMIEQQMALLDTQAAISAARGDLDAILDALVVGAMNAVVGAEGGVIELAEGDHLAYRSAQGVLKQHVGLRVPLNGSLAGACFLTAAPLLCPDARLDARTTPELARLLGTRSCLLVPVVRGGAVIGVLKLQSSRVAAFTDRDVDIVRLFAGAAAAGFAEASDAAARRAMQAAEGRYRAVFESAIDFAIIVMDLEGRVTDWNEGAVRILEWSRAEMVGRPVGVIFTPDDRADGMPGREMRSALLDGRGIDERWHLRKSGERFWANGEMMTLRAEDGAAIGYLKILRDRTAQHEAQERVLASQRRLRLERGLLQAVVQQAPVGIAIAFADDEKAIVNARMRAMLGPAGGNAGPASPGERRATPRGSLDEAMTRALRRGEELGSELVRHEDPGSGDVRHWTVSSTPIRGDGGEVLAAVSIVVDVEEQRRALRALEVSEERLALAFEASGSMGWWDWDLARDRVYASASLARFHGVDPIRAAEGFPIATFVDGVHLEDRARIRARLEAVRAAGGEFGEEYRLGADTASTVWVYARGRCYHDAEGRPVRFPGVTIDITGRKATEAAVEARQAELRTLVEAVPLGILLAEAPSGRVVMANRRVEQILGHPAIFAADRFNDNGHVGPHAGEQPVAPDEWPLARITRGDCDRASLEALYQRPDGRQVWIEVSGEAIKDAAGQTVGAVVAIVDIEERKHAEANQAILNHELGHRLKNTLAMVQAVAGQTLRNAADLPAAHEALDSRLIALGKAHDILLAGDVARADVAAVIEGALDLHDDGQNRIAARGPAFAITPSAALSLSLMIHELGTNAVKYGALSSGTGRVTVEWGVRPSANGTVFALTWTERDGPAVTPPSRKGFGSRLIERGFGTAPGSTVTLTYPPGGAVCTLEVPLDRFAVRDT